MKIVSLREKELAIEPIFAKHVLDDSTVIVFLHEALGSIGQWKSFPQNVCNALGLNGIIYEREGYGSSSEFQGQRDEYYLHNYAWEELPELIDVLIPKEKKVMLIGHSDGASIALLYAAKYPQKVKAVVSMAAHVIVEEETLKGIAPAVNAFKEGKLNGLTKYHGNKTEKLFYAWADTWNLPQFRTWNLCNDITPISCPVLAIQGVMDQYGTVKQLELIKTSIVQNVVTTQLLSKCGHHPHLEVPDEVIKMILNWFEK